MQDRIQRRCLRCRQLFWTSDRTAGFCSAGHRKDAHESTVEVEPVPVKMTEVEDARWDRNLVRLGWKPAKKRQFKMDFGRGLRTVSA